MTKIPWDESKHPRKRGKFALKLVGRFGATGHLPDLPPERAKLWWHGALALARDRRKKALSKIRLAARTGQGVLDADRALNEQYFRSLKK